MKHAVEAAEMALKMMKERHERELAEAKLILFQAQQAVAKTLGPWIKVKDQSYVAMLKGPNIPGQQRLLAAKLFESSAGYKATIHIPGTGRWELMFAGVDLDFTIGAVTAILRGEGWIVLDEE